MGNNGIKRRIYEEIRVNGKELWTIFDPGSRRSYITGSTVKKLGLKPQKLKKPFAVGLGGKSHVIKEDVAIDGVLQGCNLRLHPYLVGEITRTPDGKGVEMLFGIEDMETWYVELDIEHKKVDMSKFPSEFVEL